MLTRVHTPSEGATTLTASRRSSLPRLSGEMPYRCAALPTLRASQVGSCGAPSTGSLKAVGDRFRFNALGAAAFSGPSQASACTAAPAGR